ncbi:MAG TPA: hypothetical protein VM681_09230 [Candidatus Thermoplasmatota archaeon]|nr:hypothetical protein [Candidatus Thermoplasmatota archaeon]
MSEAREGAGLDARVSFPAVGAPSGRLAVVGLITDAAYAAEVSDIRDISTVLTRMQLRTRRALAG